MGRRHPKSSRLSERISRIEQLLAENLMRESNSGMSFLPSVIRSESVLFNQNLWTIRIFSMTILLTSTLPTLLQATPPAAPVLVVSSTSPYFRLQRAFTSLVESWVSSASSLVSHSSYQKAKNGSSLAQDRPFQARNSVHHGCHGRKSEAGALMKF